MTDCHRVVRQVPEPLPIGLCRERFRHFFVAREELNSVNVLPKFCRYVSANVLGMIGLSCYILADTFFIANAIGADALAALNIAIPVFNLINAAGLMTGVGGGTRYAILRAQKENQSANRLFSGIVLLAAGAGILLWGVGMTAAAPLARLLGADAVTLPLCTVYLRTILCFAPFFLLNSTLQAFVRNDGAPRLAMAGMLTSSLSNVVLDWVFMYPLSMGMFGAAIATCIAPILSLCVLATHFLHPTNRLRFSLKSAALRPAVRALSLGASSFVCELSSGVVLLVFNLLILSFTGNVGVAAYGIIANLALVGLAIFTGVAQGVQPLTSHAYGTGNTAEQRQLLRLAVGLVLILAAVCYLAVNLWPDPLISAFNRDADPQLAAIARTGMRIYFLGFFFAGPNLVLAAFFSAVDRPAQGFWTAMIRGLIALIPLALLLAWLLGMTGIWLAYVLAEGCGLAFALLCLLRDKHSA